MSSIKKTQVVPYRKEQMYALVNDVASYQEFVPYCSKSEVIRCDANEVSAKLTFSSRGMTKSFTTINRLQPHKMIEIRLLQGPFRHLEGFWRFDELSDQESRVSLDMEFEFSSPLLTMVFGPLFNQVAAKLVDAFCERAQVVYHD